MYKYIKLILSFSCVIFFIFIVAIYSNNRELIKFNNIKLIQSKIITEDLLFNHIDYNLDSINYYSNQDLNNFKDRIYDLEKNGIIKNIKLSYSLPNKILVNITNNKPVYILDIKNNKFILDERGAIYDTKFLSSSASIPKVNLIFSSNEFYHDWYSEENLELKTLINNINKNKLNDKYLLDIFEILNWFKSNYLYTHVTSVSIQENTINFDLGKTKILFSKNNQNIKNEINKINEIINNQFLLDSLKIDDLTDLKEIKLFYNNQIVIKS